MKVVDTADRDAFEALYRSAATDLLRLAVLLTGDRHAAEDAVAEATTRTWRRWEQGRIDDPAAYLRRAVVNAVTDHHRRRGRLQARRQQRSGDDRGVPLLDDVATRRRVVLDALAELPVEQRAVIALRYYDDRSEAEIASILGISLGTVKSRASRGLRALAPRLRDQEVPGG